MIQIRAVGLEAFRRRALARSRSGPVTAAVHARLANAWTSGAERFVRVAVARVLVESGMSAASFFPLSRAIARLREGSLAQVVVEEHIRAGRDFLSKKNIKTKRRSSLGNTHPTFPSGNPAPGRRSVALGQKAGKDAYILNLGSSKRPIFRFVFEAKVFQLAFHDANRGGLLAGAEAFRSTIRLRFAKEARFVLNQWLQSGRIIPGQDVVTSVARV